MCGEKRIELNSVRADLYPDPTPLLLNTPRSLPGRNELLSPLFLAGEPETPVNTTPETLTMHRAGPVNVPTPPAQEHPPLAAPSCNSASLGLA